MLTPAHTFNCQPSRQYVVILSCLLLASFVLVAFLSVHFATKLALMAGLLVYGVYLVKQAFLATPRSILGFACDESQVWHLTLPSIEVKGSLDGESVVTPWVLLLRFNTGKQRLSCLIFRDTLAQDQFRQLSVLLRLRFTG